ncbi:MAG: primase, partial [Actinomycetota bacterium]
MGILAEDVARVRDATDFVQIASERMSLKKVGTRWTGLCPFHA